MRKAVAVWLLGLLLAGCAQATKTPAPEPQPADCQGPAAGQAPVLAGIVAFGLDGPQFWIPGSAIKVNWMQNAAGTGNVSGWGQMKVRLQRHGASGAAYQAEFAPAPSLIGFPAAGCWDVTVTWEGRSDSTRVFFEQAQLTGVAAGPDEASLWADAAAAQELFQAAAKPSGDGIPKDRPAARLDLVWSHSSGQYTAPMLYLPESKGSAPMIVIGKSLVTGDCRDADKPVAARMSTRLAKRLEQNLGSKLKIEPQPPNPWLNISGACKRFSPL